MPLFGAHMSIAGGLENAILAAERFGCETVQLFSKNSNQWKAKPLSQPDIQRFRDLLRRSGLKYPTAHDSYLINLASPDTELWNKSVAAFVDEVQRAESLGLRYLVMHPGAHMGTGEEVGLQRVIVALDRVHAETAGFKVQVLLESTAGQGTTLGYRFEHLAYLLQNVQAPGRLGVCLDTCHIFAAGYALESRESYTATFAEFGKIVGLKWLKLFHLNDSKKPLGSRVDRHEHIGKGCIGLEPFRRLVNDPRFRKLPMILETPKENDAGEEMDPVNLAVLRGLMEDKGS